MRPKLLLFDLDDTLYPPTSGLWDEIGTRIDEYIYNHLSLPREEIPAFRNDLYHRYGTTLRGLQVLHHIDPLEYLKFVHDVPLEQYLQPDPALKAALQKIPIPKWIFTNADINHAQRVTELLGIGECFERIIDILDVTPYCKPMPEAYQKALAIMQIENPAEVTLFEDTSRNIQTARDLGFYTVQVGGSSNHVAHDHIPTLRDIDQLFTPDFSLRDRGS
jgi:pyrimidine 5'-nucleotidase